MFLLGTGGIHLYILLSGEGSIEGKDKRDHDSLWDYIIGCDCNEYSGRDSINKEPFRSKKRTAADSTEDRGTAIYDDFYMYAGEFAGIYLVPANRTDCTADSLDDLLEIYEENVENVGGIEYDNHIKG